MRSIIGAAMAISLQHSTKHENIISFARVELVDNEFPHDFDGVERLIGTLGGGIPSSIVFELSNAWWVINAKHTSVSISTTVP